MAYNGCMEPTKTALRRKLRRDRLALSEKEHARLSLAVSNRLRQALDWYALDKIHYFEPIKDLQEVDITPFTRLLSPRKRLYTSRKEEGAWQIVSINGELETEIPACEVIIVPMLGFDQHLHRIGYGGGYYDKFLATQPKAKKIGVCFEMGRLNSIPAEPHDIPLDLIVTEDSIYKP